MKTTDLFRFTHISDPHLTNLDHVRAADLMSKRITGYLLWQLQRRHIHKHEVLSAVVSKACKDGEHLVITGDLTQLGLVDEFEQVNQWLERLGSPSDVSVIPGNHDAYVPAALELGLEKLRPWMSNDQGGINITTDTGFPYVRRRGSVVFFGVSSAVPQPPLFATGRVDKYQLDALSQGLAQTKGLFRVVLMHHSPVPAVDKFRKRLINAGDLRVVLAQHGAELVLHGHTHQTTWHTIPGPQSSIPVIGTASASASGSHTAAARLSISRGGYHAYEVMHSDRQWQLKVSSYRLEEVGDKMILDDQRHFILPVPMATLDLTD